MFSLSALLPLAVKEPSFWMPPAATQEAADVDATFRLIEWVNYLYGIPIFLVLLYFVWRYRRREGIEPDPSPHHSFLLEITWTVIPTIMIVGIFFVGFVQYIGMTTMPGDPYEIEVVAKKWDWTFSYPGGGESNELHVPAGRNVLLTMRSTDVMHSLFIPAFRVKRDIIPGRYTQLWFNALSPDGAAAEVYPLFCTEYCGKSHWDMGGAERVFVHHPSDFDVWLEDVRDLSGKLPPDEYGKYLWEQKCRTCHSIDGKAGTGPSWKGIWGEQHAFTDGSSAEVDADYIRESILYPQAKVVKGYRGVMPNYQGQMRDREIAGIVEFIKSITLEKYEKLPAPNDLLEAEGGEQAAATGEGSAMGEVDGAAGSPSDGNGESASEG